MQRSASLRTLILLAIFSAIALTVFVLESYIPAPVPIPGVKLGLANCISLLVMLLLGPWQAFIVLIIRVLLGSLLTGQLVSLSFSLGGGILSFLVTVLSARFLQHRYIPLISVLGALAHNVGQILVALVILRQPGILVYLPVLVISAIVTGLFTGLIAHFTLPSLRKICRKP